MALTLDNVEDKSKQAKKFLQQEKEALDASDLFNTMVNDNSIVSRITIDIPGAGRPVTFSSDILPPTERGALIAYLRDYFQNLATSKRTDIDNLFA